MHSLAQGPKACSMLYVFFLARGPKDCALCSPWRVARRRVRGMCSPARGLQACDMFSLSSGPKARGMLPPARHQKVCGMFSRRVAEGVLVGCQGRVAEPWAGFMCFPCA